MLAFIDNIALVAIGKNFHDTHHSLKDMLEHQGRGFDWSQDHNSKFETNKFALINFSINRYILLYTFMVFIIHPSPIYCFLGVILNQELCWKAQVDNALAKGLAYVL
jgi:hypothetical protein